MTKLIYISVILTLLMSSCKIDKTKGKELGYEIRSTNTDEIKVTYNGDVVDMLKVKSKYFETFIPATWFPKITNDSIFVAIDTIDQLRDNISITYSKIGICNIDDFSKKKAAAIISSGYNILEERTESVEDSEYEILRHEIVMHINAKKLKQRCYYICPNSEHSIMCCLTTTVDSYYKKVTIIDIATNFLTRSL